MELKDICKVTLDKGNKKVMCYKFKHRQIGRELAVHEHVDYKNLSTITDFTTGCRLCDIRKEIKNVTKDDIKEALDKLIKHYTLEEVKRSCTIKEEKLKGMMKK